MKKTLQLLCMVVFATATIQAQVVAIGGTVNINGVLYTVTNDAVGLETVNAGNYANEGATSGTDGTAIGALVIPASITSAGITYNVTGLEWQAFAGNTSITSVDLSALTITELPQQAFYGNPITSVILPSTVTKIGQSCFQNCSAVKSINTGNITDLSSQSAMGEMAALTSVDFSKVTTIGKRSFRSSNAITTLALPSITSLGDSSINSTSLTTLSIGSGLTSVNSNTFNSLPALTALYWNVVDPTTLSPTFTGSTLGNVTLYVPTEADVTAYKANAYWFGLGFKAIVAGTLSTNNLEQELGFSFYPNPTNGVVSIKSKQLNNASVGVYDLNGRVILNKTISGTSSEINMSNLASGIYLFKVQVEDAAFTKRIVKQ